MPYLGLEHIDPGTGRILVTEVEARQTDSRSNNFRFTAEHVLYGKLRPYLNKVALPDFSGRCTTEIVPLRPTAVDRVWLAWLLRRGEVVDYAMRGKTGTQMPRTSMPDLMKLPVALPPLDEQRRIVNAMSLVDRARSAAEAQLTAIDELTTAMLREIFPRSPTAPLRRGWRSVSLGEVCNIMNGSTPRSGVEEYWNGDICWITPADLSELESPYISTSGRAITQTGYDSCSTTLVPAGSVILSSRAPIGHLGIAATSLCTNQGCKSFIPKDDLVSEFLYYALLHSVSDLRALGTGATFAEVSKRTLAGFRIAVGPAEEQRRITDQMRAVQRARSSANSQLAALEDLSASLLKRLFSPATG